MVVLKTISQNSIVVFVEKVSRFLTFYHQKMKILAHIRLKTAKVNKSLIIANLYKLKKSAHKVHKEMITANGMPNMKKKT